MNKIISTIESHKFVATIILILLIFGGGLVTRLASDLATGRVINTRNFDKMHTELYEPPYSGQSTSPIPAKGDRKVVQQVSISSLVLDVEKAADSLISRAESLGGFLVNSAINKDLDRVTAHLQIRVPSKKVEEFIVYLKENSVNITAISRNATDYTDQYEDLDKQIYYYQQVISKMEEILRSATNVMDMVSINQQILAAQQNIDNLTGRKTYIENITDTSLITVNLSNDELALSYIPENGWNPKTTFKLAVRSMIGTLQQFGKAGIWLIAYLPVLALVWFLIQVFKVIKKFFWSPKKTNLVK